jgi:hypothetical protein
VKKGVSKSEVNEAFVIIQLTRVIKTLSVYMYYCRKAAYILLVVQALPLTALGLYRR